MSWATLAPRIRRPATPIIQTQCSRNRKESPGPASSDVVTMQPWPRAPPRPRDVDDSIGGDRMDGVRRLVGKTRPRSLVVICVALSLAVVAAIPAKSNAQGGATGWSIVSSPNAEGYNWLQAVDASASDNAWAVGFYIGTEGVYETLAERWDGSAWKLVQTPNVGVWTDRKSTRLNSSHITISY